jgi:bifunctional NMN adenylyltransferase/nudix hydrolase
MNTVGVIVARFQTPYLHEGHKHILEEIRSRHNKIIVVLGVSPVKGSRHNPFDFYTRERMLKQYNPSFVVLPLADESSDKQWSIHLDNLLRNSFPMETFILYGSRDCFIFFYSGNLTVEELPKTGDYSATSIRNANSDKVRDTEDFRMGINYAYHNTYTKVYSTVDIALFNADNTKLLLGRKHASTEWRFPGGFTDTTDENYEAAARREVAEECGNIETAKMQYIGSARIDDWRYRNEADKIITLFFKTSVVFGKPAAGDDLEEIKWVTLEELELMRQNGQLSKEHSILTKMLLNNLSA